MMRLLVVSTVALFATSFAAKPEPHDDCASCSHNGVCSKGRCECYPQWTGKYCESLNLVAGKRALGYQGNLNGSRVTSWGGAPLRGPDGKYHMMVSEITNSAGMVPWACNSHIVHTISDDPLTQPFIRVRTLWEVFAHEPRCTQAPTGEYVCYFSYNPNYNKQEGAPCSGENGNTDKDCKCGNGAKPTYMSFTSDLNGEWSKPVEVAAGSEERPGFLGLPDLNVAPYIFSNGTLLALYRNNVGSNIHILTAPDWRDPKTYHRSQVDISVGLPEDPFLWRDAKGIFHTLNHAYPFPSGPHAWSEDGMTWHKAPGETNPGRGYPQQATFTDADPIMAGCRERPSLIFAEDGVTPIALVNGFSPDSSHVGDQPSGSCRFAGVDYSVTLVQPINQQGKVII